MAWKPDPQGYRDRVNSLIERRRAIGTRERADYLIEKQKAEAAVEEAEQKKKRGWGLPALLGAGVGTLIAPGIGTAIGAGLGGGAGLLQAGSTRGGGVGGVLKSLTDIPGALAPIIEDPSTVISMLDAFAPYMKGLKGASGGKGGGTTDRFSGYGWDNPTSLNVNTDLGGLDPGLSASFGEGGAYDGYVPPADEMDFNLEEPGDLEEDDDDAVGSYLKLKLNGE